MEIDTEISGNFVPEMGSHKFYHRSPESRFEEVKNDHATSVLVENSTEFKQKTNQSESKRIWNQKIHVDSSSMKTCGQCDFTFDTIQELMSHVKKTAGHTPQCVHCDSSFADFNNYRKHVRKFHMSDSEIICQECGKTSTTYEQQQLHWSLVHKVEEDLFCNICGLGCQNMFKLR